MKIRLLQSYEVLWIHNIDGICILDFSSSILAVYLAPKETCPCLSDSAFSVTKELFLICVIAGIHYITSEIHRMSNTCSKCLKDPRLKWQMKPLLFRGQSNLKFYGNHQKINLCNNVTIHYIESVVSFDRILKKLAQSKPFEMMKNLLNAALKCLFFIVSKNWESPHGKEDPTASSLFDA